MPQLDQNTRRRIYQVATAAMPLLVFYGLISDQVAPLWLGLVVAILGGAPPALAAANSRDRPPEHRPEGPQQ